MKLGFWYSLVKTRQCAPEDVNDLEKKEAEMNNPSSFGARTIWC